MHEKCLVSAHPLIWVVYLTSPPPSVGSGISVLPIHSGKLVNLSAAQASHLSGVNDSPYPMGLWQGSVS